MRYSTHINSYDRVCLSSLNILKHDGLHARFAYAMSAINTFKNFKSRFTMDTQYTSYNKQKL